MNKGMIATRYAKALLQYAQEHEAEDTIFEEMKKVEHAYANEPKLCMAMHNPMVTTADKLKLVEAIFEGKLSNQLQRFIELILTNKREAHLQSIALRYSDLYCIKKKINRGKLITAIPIGDELVTKIKSILKQIRPDGTLELVTSVDPDIQGGFVLYIDTYRYDASIATQLQQIKQDFIAQATKTA